MIHRILTHLPIIALLMTTLLRPASSPGADTALTIYNQNFAVVRDTVPLNLQPGTNDVIFTGTTAHLEPDSVILRDPTGQHALRLLQPNYRNDPNSPRLRLAVDE